MIPDRLARRAAQLVVGSALLGAGVALLLRAGLGMDPYGVFLEGASARSGLSFGTVNAAAGLVLVVLCWWPGRVRPGPAALVQPLVLGVSADLVLAVVGPPGGLAARLALAVFAAALIGATAGLYLGAGLGAGPVDGLPFALRRLFPGQHFAVLYGASLAVLLLLGWAVGGTVGPATPVLVLVLGPILGWAQARTTVSAPGICPA